MANSEKFPYQRAFGLSLPFNWFLFNDHEDLDWYINWECERQPWWDEFDSLPHHITHEIQHGEYGVYEGDVDVWFKEEQGYDNGGIYKDGSREFIIHFTVYVIESVLGKTIFECKKCTSQFTKDGLNESGLCYACELGLKESE